MAEEQVQTEPAAEPKKGGALKKVVLLLSVLLVFAAGGAAYWVLGGEKAAAAQETRIDIKERGVVPFETFLVNLSDPGGTRFLKVSLGLVVESEEASNLIGGSASLMSHLRSAILELLTEQKALSLVTAEGKQALKDAIKKRVAGILTEQQVLDVLFSEFVVQF
jgi:flagellar FliL protein